MMGNGAPQAALDHDDVGSAGEHATRIAGDGRPGGPGNSERNTLAVSCPPAGKEFA